MNQGNGIMTENLREMDFFRVVELLKIENGKTTAAIHGVGNSGIIMVKIQKVWISENMVVVGKPGMRVPGRGKVLTNI